ncbi:unnamed protein product [Clonostachys solani]|uniref:Oxidase FUB9 n=1 Tax=Clonostachys solani TaxID=160281 RepID=A0A9N9ZK72_9HYPO|nr:unnamed protein product [Clonostachys solani]
MISDLTVSPAYWLLLLIGLAVVGVASVPIYNLFFHPLRKFPGPKLNAATRIPYTRMISSGQTHHKLHEMHKKYGDMVRISPDELSVQGEHVWDDLMGHLKQGAPENGKDPGFFSFSKSGNKSISLAVADITHVNLIEEKLKARGAMETIRPDYYHAKGPESSIRHSKRLTNFLDANTELHVLITAGSETTATTLSGATYLLGKHPEVLRKLVKEVRTTFKHENEINMHSVQRLEYMLAVLNEALRLYPPVPGAIPRMMNPEGGIINGRWVPGGDSDGWIDRGETYLIWSKPALNVHLVPARLIRRALRNSIGHWLFTCHHLNSSGDKMVTIKTSNERVLCVDDIRKIATAKLPQIISDFYNDGSTTQVTVHENSSAYSKYRLRARVFVDVSKVDPSTTVLGEKIDFPLCVSPAGLQAMAHPDGELATARACAKRRVHMGISSFANHSVEDIRTAGLSVGPLTNAIQLYTMRDKEMQLRIIHRAEAAGCKAIFLTADSPVLGVRYNEVYNDFRTPDGLNLPMLEKTSEMIRSQTHDDGFTAFNSDSHSWEREIPWLRRHSKMEIWIKGVLTAEDVHLAVQYGCDGIIVSNHGGRQLDETPATADVLLECAKAANGKIRIHVDGGIRTGTDIFKALALGAQCVWIGRPMIWGLAYNGEAGVTKTLDILYEEFKRCMQLTGCNTVADISLASIGAVITYIIAKIVHEFFLHPLRKYPGPLLSRFTRIPYWIANLTGNQVRHMHQLHSRYGPIVRYGPNDMSYTDHQAWKDIYGHKKDRQDNPKDQRFYPQPDSGVHSLITASKEDHARVRRMFALAFSDRGLKQQEPLFQKYADLMVSKLHELSTTEQDLVKILNFTTFDIMAELTFGEPLGLLEGSKYSPWVSNIFQAIKAGPVMQMGLYYPLLGYILKSLAPKKLQELRRSHAQHTISRVDQLDS